MKFTHRTGERPLPGFTIKRGVGQGGFGEVYFAESDAGKEVALKLLRGSSDIELRGVANCLNLKHPNLVHIYDLKTDDRGGQWLIMEYVLGESLAQVLDRHPNGLPVEVALEWFRGLAKAVIYLHDHGVVHRDLKPANIFIEHGNLKVGDYGLCKAMGTSGRPQTRAVGTVHYMAPEISNGLYTKSIDVYACGVILFEMLAGRPPFDGQTDAEILMKHLTADADLSKVPEVLRKVVGKALEKTPARRYDSLNAMVQAIDALAPTAAQAIVTPTVMPASPSSPSVLRAPPPLHLRHPIPRLAVPMAIPLPIAKPVRETGVPLRDRITDLSGAVVRVPMVIAIGVIPWAALSGHLDELVPLGKGFLIGLAIAWAALVANSGTKARPVDPWGRRLRMVALGLLVGALTFWLDGWPLPESAADAEEASTAETYLFGQVRMSPTALPVLGHYMLYFAATMGLTRWWKMAARDRKERFSLWWPITAGFWGLVMGFLWPWHFNIDFGAVPLALAAIAVQWVSPWTPPPPPAPKRLRWRG